MSMIMLPSSRIPDPREAPPLRWGILGAGGIAAQFTNAAQRHTRQIIAAVGSRSDDRAAEFAARHGIDRHYGSYQALVDDPGIDVIYVASPHSEHLAHALTAIAAGKHVLVEKAFARSAGEAQQIADAARSAGVFAMEAMWTRFLPHIDVVRQLLADGALGDVSTVIADHGQFFRDLDPAHRLLNPELAGGALLDLGIYPVSFAAFVLGADLEMTSFGSLTATGVDAQVSMVATPQAGSAQALINTTLLAQTPTTASISGSAGRLELAGPFYAPARLAVTGVGDSGSPLVREVGPITGHEGLCFEAAEVARCVAEGRGESPLLPLADSVAIMRLTDAVREQIGVRYPGE